MKEKRPNTRLRRERELRGWSQRKLADLLGTAEQVVNRWESGQHKPNRYFQTQLCQLFGKSAEELGFMLPTPDDLPRNVPAQHAQHIDNDLHQQTILSSISARSLSTQAPIKEDAFMFPVPITEREIAGETVTLLDCATWFGLKLAGVVTLVHQWYGMAVFCNELQDQLDREIKKLEALKLQYSPDEYILSRQEFLTTLATLPAALLTSIRQKHKFVLVLEEFLPQCAASLVASWHLSGGSHLEAIGPILDSYLPTLISVIKQAPSYRKIAAALVAQTYSLKAIMAWHLESLDNAEADCVQALHYSNIANDTNLRLTALNQRALIAYYGKNFEQALAKSEEADATLKKASQKHIFPIVQGRVFMYLAAIQAQQKIKAAEHTLEHAHQAFALQMTLAEPVPMYADCGNASLMLWDGLTHYYLGQHETTHARRALASLQISGQLEPSAAIPERFRLECLNNRTLAVLQLGEMDEAISCAVAGKQGAKSLESKQRSTEVSYAHLEMLKRWSAEARVQALEDAPDDSN